MDFIIKFNMDNDTFKVWPEAEVARILNEIANKVMDGLVFGSIRDLNGNKVGDWEFD